MLKINRNPENLLVKVENRVNELAIRVCSRRHSGEWFMIPMQRIQECLETDGCVCYVRYAGNYCTISAGEDSIRFDFSFIHSGDSLSEFTGFRDRFSISREKIADIVDNGYCANFLRFDDYVPAKIDTSRVSDKIAAMAENPAKRRAFIRAIQGHFSHGNVTLYPDFNAENFYFKYSGVFDYDGGLILGTPNKQVVRRNRLGKFVPFTVQEYRYFCHT